MAEQERAVRWQATRTTGVEAGVLDRWEIPAGVRGEGGATLQLAQELAIDDPAYRVVRGLLTLAGGRFGVPVELDLNPYAQLGVELALRPIRVPAYRHRRRQFAYANAAHDVLDRLASQFAEDAKQARRAADQAA